HVRADPLSDSPDETTGASPDGRAPVCVSGRYCSGKDRVGRGRRNRSVPVSGKRSDRFVRDGMTASRSTPGTEVHVQGVDVSAPSALAKVHASRATSTAAIRATGRRARRLGRGAAPQADPEGTETSEYSVSALTTPASG